MQPLKAPGRVTKRRATSALETSAPHKRTKLLLENESSSDESLQSGDDETGVLKEQANNSQFRINEAYARRFEYNKTREEHERLKSKYGQGTNSTQVDNISESSSSEDEDDDGVLATGDLDAQVQQTLEAIQKKDPRVYDSTVKFYADSDDSGDEDRTKIKESKPMFLKDYHRKTLLDDTDGNGVNEATVPTYAEEQQVLKNALISEAHAILDGNEEEVEEEDNEDNDDFLIKKATQSSNDVGEATEKNGYAELSIESADADPDKFLANFLSARAWIPTETSRFEPLESDDEEEERRADAFEDAYNMRFENPETSNEKLVSHARDTAAKFSVRKEAVNSRQRARETERATKQTDKQTRAEEKARLRKLKIQEFEKKMQKIKDAAGLQTTHVPDTEWSRLLDDAWDDEQWNEMMKRRFGQDYYESHDINEKSAGSGQRSGKFKKPTWEDDIDIEDIVPDFEAARQQTAQETQASTSQPDGKDSTAHGGEASSKPHPAKKALDLKKQSRLERRRIEEAVDENMYIEEKLSSFGKRHGGFFRYRETSPQDWGMTAADILLADDSHLNQYAGLKKLAAFRDPEKKKKDQKRLGKKDHLRKWRYDTFGSRDGPRKSLAEVISGSKASDKAAGAAGRRAIEAKAGHRKRRK